MTASPHIVVIGLGYVGLPLAVALARQFETIGFDIDAGRIAELREGHDRTREVDADALVIVTEWDEFRALDLDELAKRMRGNILVDLRNVWDPKEAERAGFAYVGIGRGKLPG